jgi:hypothetical protein
MKTAFVSQRTTMEFVNTSNDNDVLYQMLSFKVVTCKTLNQVRRRRTENGVIIYKSKC